MEDNFGLHFLRRNFHISCFDFSAYFKCGLAHVDIYFQTGICSANCILLSLLVISSGQSCVPNQSFWVCIYGGQLWSDFCAGHFVAGFSLGGWQRRSDSPTGAQDRRAGRPNGLGPGLTSLMDTDTAAGRSDYPEQQ